MSKPGLLYLIIIVTFVVACGNSKKAANNWETIVVKTTDTSNSLLTILSPEQRLRVKYAAWLKTDPDSLKNITLYRFIDKWMNTPYRWGGIDEKGIDCSAFMQRLLQDVYNILVPRTSVEQFFTKNVEPFHDGHYFAEGDLIFFATIPGKPVSHVGFYLQNRVFVNASSSQGVSLANLDDPYWKKRYVAAGRVKKSFN
jgi:lipoprotein Spr